VTHFILHYGLVLVFLVVAAESAGAPLPGETALVAAAVAASQGRFSITSVIIVSAAGAIVGDNVGYWLGRELGRGFLQRYAVIARFSARVLPRAEKFFDDHGGKAVFAARWFSGFRIAGAWVAGFAHMPWWRFLLWNAAGGISWATTVGLLSYYLGSAAGDAISHYGLIGAGVVVVFVVLVVVAMRLVRRRMEET
jgi:membrane protein DedA with SNARE-associated domain